MSNDWTDPATWGLRQDNTPKGSGFLGVLKRPDGGVSSELSIGVNLDGHEVEIPAIVPTLSPEEVSHLLTNPGTAPMPLSIVQKAADFARQRKAAGLPYFAQPNEQNLAQHPQFERSHVTSMGASLLAPSHGQDNSAPYRNEQMPLALRDLLVSKLNGQK